MSPASSTTRSTQPTRADAVDHAAVTVPLTAAAVLGLQGYRADPSVSLLLTTRPGPALDPADRARLRALARQARDRLGTQPEHGAGDRITDLLDTLDALVENVTGPVDRAIAVFASPARVARFDLPVEVLDRCVIDPTFATRDLVRSLHRTPPPRRAATGRRPGPAPRRPVRGAGSGHPRLPPYRPRAPARRPGPRVVPARGRQVLGRLPAAAPRPAGHRRRATHAGGVPEDLPQHPPPRRHPHRAPPRHPDRGAPDPDPSGDRGLPALPPGRSAHPARPA